MSGIYFYANYFRISCFLLFLLLWLVLLLQDAVTAATKFALMSPRQEGKE